MLTPTKPSVEPGRRYAIKEACELLGICRSTLRKWTNNGLIQAKVHPADGHLFYPAEEIMRFWNQTI